jgi:hypothetical protein
LRAISWHQPHARARRCSAAIQYMGANATKSAWPQAMRAGRVCGWGTCTRCFGACRSPAASTLWRVQRRPQSSRRGDESAGSLWGPENRPARFFGPRRPAVRLSWLRGMSRGCEEEMAPFFANDVPPTSSLVSKVSRLPRSLKRDLKKFKYPKQRQLLALTAVSYAPSEKRVRRSDIHLALYIFVIEATAGLYRVR